MNAVLQDSAPAPAAGRSPRVTVVIPAHNEQQGIAATIASVWGQTHPVDRLVVVADNCDDLTAPTAAAMGAEVIPTVANRHKKAGGLNQVLGQLLATTPDDDVLLVMDADSELAPRFVARALAVLAEDDADRNPDRGRRGRRSHRRPIGAVGGIFLARDEPGLLARLQANEYQRYARQIGRNGGRAQVLTGTATLFRVRALRAVWQARHEGLLPGTRVYDTAALTEDNEITMALKHLGYRCVSPRECVVRTEVMTTWRALFKQRLRWQRGALENLGAYGITPVSLPYALRQAAMHLGMVMLPLYLLTLTLTIALRGSVQARPLWLAVTALFMVERVVSVRRAGWRAMALAAPLLVEMAYDLFQQAVYLRALHDVVRRRPAQW